LSFSLLYRVSLSLSLSLITNCKINNSPIFRGFESDLRRVFLEKSQLPHSLFSPNFSILGFN
ncbi:hypothetical protein GIB67_023129, partial [Kingdonia uniflora]